MSNEAGPAPGLAGQFQFLLLAVAAGLAGGAAAVLFRALAEELPRLVWPEGGTIMEAVAVAPAPLRLGIPVVGALLAGLVLAWGTRWVAGPARGWDILEAVALRDGILHFRPAVVKAASSLVTVASASPIGREGPMVLLSAALCSRGARWLRVPVRQRRVLVGCGIAAGMATAYNAPIGAALFTMEVIVGNFALDVFAPLVFASVVSTLLARAVFTNDPMFQLGSFEFVSFVEVVPYCVLGLLGGLVAVLFMRALRRAATWFRGAQLPRPLAMAVAGLFVGIAVHRVPQIVGNGRESIVEMFHESWAPGFLVLLLVTRMLATALTVGSGAVGGVFTPTLFLGALLGEAFGIAVHAIAPGWIAGPKAYALIGMGTLLAGTTHAPITAVLMLFEMTLEYEIVLPMLIASAAASLVARSMDERSIYTEALHRKRGAPRATGEAAVMAKLTVSDVMRADHTVVAADMPLPRLVDKFIRERRNHQYVVDASGRFLGAISLYEASRALRESPDAQHLTALDLANTAFQSTVPGEHLDRTLERFWLQESERLPVLDGPHGRVLGTISKRDILGVYSLEVLHRRSLLARFDEETGADGTRPNYVELPEDAEIEEVPVPADLVGTTFRESRFRERYNLSVLVVRRVDAKGKVQRLIPEASTRLEQGDRLIVFGLRSDLDRVRDTSGPPGGTGYL